MVDKTLCNDLEQPARICWIYCLAGSKCFLGLHIASHSSASLERGIWAMASKVCTVKCDITFLPLILPILTKDRITVEWTRWRHRKSKIVICAMFSSKLPWQGSPEFLHRGPQIAETTTGPGPKQRSDVVTDVGAGTTRTRDKQLTWRHNAYSHCRLRLLQYNTGGSSQHSAGVLFDLYMQGSRYH